MWHHPVPFQFTGSSIMDGNATANARQFWAFLLISYLSAVMVLQCLGKETHFSAMAQRWPNAGCFFSGQSPGHPMDELHSDSHETVSLLALEKHVIGQHHKLQRLIQAKNQTTERDKTQHEQNYNSELLPHEFCLKIWMANVLLCFTYALPSLVKKTKTASAEFVIRRSSGRPDNKSRAAVGQWPEGIEKDKLEDAARR